MPANSFWDDAEQTIYCIHMSGTWEWEDFTNAVNVAYVMLGKLSHKVDFVMGFLSPLPEGSALAPLTHAGATQPPNIRHTVMLNQTGRATTLFMSSLIEAVDNINEWEGPKFVSSMDECREYLYGLRKQDS